MRDKALHHNDAKLYFFSSVDKRKSKKDEMLPRGHIEIRG